MAVAMAVLLASGVLIGGAGAVSAAPADLVLSIAPAKLATARDQQSFATVHIANPGDQPVSKVRIALQQPGGVTAVVEPDSIEALAPANSTVAKLRLTGTPVDQPASLVVQAVGSTDGGAVSGLATLELVVQPEPVAVVLAGNARLSDAAPAELVAVVTNTSGAPAVVSLEAKAGKHSAKVAHPESDPLRDEVIFRLEPKASSVVRVRVKAEGGLSRGKVAVVVLVRVTPEPHGNPSVLTANRELETATSVGDLLPAPLETGSPLVLPGLLAVAAGLAVERWDRRKLGLSPPGVAATLWDNKLWLLASVPVSLVAVLLYDQVADTNLLDAAEVKHLVLLVAVTGVAGAGASAIRVVLHRRKVPRINAGSFERDVLSAAARAGGTVRRVAYQADDDHVGVFVHRDRDALVLSPSIYFSRPDPLTEITDTTPIEEADDKATATFDGRYADDKEGEITRPTAILAENAKSATPRDLLQYRDVRERAAPPACAGGAALWAP